MVCTRRADFDEPGLKEITMPKLRLHYSLTDRALGNRQEIVRARHTDFGRQCSQCLTRTTTELQHFFENTTT